MSKTIKRPVGFFKKIILKTLTKAQEFSLNRMAEVNVTEFQEVVFYYNLYMRVTKLHFKLYFKLDLVREASLNTLEFTSAAERHKIMVAKSIKKVTQIELNKSTKDLIKRTFRDNLILETPL